MTNTVKNNAATDNATCLARADAVLLHNYRRKITMVRGSGSEIWDADGRRYIDMGGGVAVNSLGHSHSELIHAVATQAATLIHCSNYFHNLPAIELAEKLVALSGEGKIFLCNSGLEANEALFKLARRFGHRTGGRHTIITTLGSFHGRSLAAIAATGQDKVREGFDPVTPGFKHVPYNDLDAVREAATADCCAVLIEGIQGEGGITCATPEFLLGLRKLCDEKNLLLLVDAIQCGMFRTGRFHSYERILENEDGDTAFAPDAFSLAKSLGGGFPVGAVWIASRHADILDAGSHGTTFGGNPLACAAANCVLEIIERDRLAANARRQGERLASQLAILTAEHPDLIRECRGLGLMQGVAFHHDPADLRNRLLENGLILIPAAGHVLRWLPALNVEDHILDEAVDIFRRTLAEVPAVAHR